MIWKQAGQSAEMRIAGLSTKLLQLFYAYVSRSLFKADRLTFSLHLCHGRVRFHIIRNARIENVGKIQSCMAFKLRVLWNQAQGTPQEIPPQEWSLFSGQLGAPPSPVATAAEL